MRRAGGPELLCVECLPEPLQATGQSLVDVSLAGGHFDDLERPNGDYRPLILPAVLGVDVGGRRRRDGRRVAVLREPPLARS
jgi:NADPH2:quinone reductase